MIVFACAMSDAEAYRRWAGPGIERVREPDSVVLPFGNPAGPARGGNLVLDEVRRLDDVEALVLVTERTELVDAATCAVVRAALADPAVALAGIAGSSGAPGIDWWDGDVSAASGIHRYAAHGGGDLPLFGWADPAAAPAAVDALDGGLLAFSPWALGHLRFDEAIAGTYGHDRDLCLQATAAGRTLRTMALGVVRHHELDLVDDLDLWIEAHIAVASKWRPDEDEQDWRARARRAEAEREAARTVAYTNASLLDARVAELERRMDAVTGSASWRVTEPLRALNAARRARAGSRRG